MLPQCVQRVHGSLEGVDELQRREKEYANTNTHTHTHITWPTYVLLPTMTSWAERWPQFVQGSKWEVEEKLK